MQIHRFRGRNLREALQRAQRAHGEEAVVLSQETMSDGGVTIAVVDDAPSRGLPRRENAPRRKAARADAKPANPGLDDVRRRMEASGISRDLSVQILGAVRRAGARGAYAIDVAARALGQVFPVAPSPKVPARKSGAEGTGAARVIAFVGPTGVGKTTTLAKLAIRLAQAGRRVVAATMDTYRVGAVDQLRTYADLLEIPAVVAATGDDLAEAVRERSDADVVLVDTTGRSPRDAGNLAKLAAALERADNGVELDRYLVLSAASRPRDLDEAGRGFAATRPSALVITKLDETNEPASALEYSIYAGLGLAFLCDGQDVRAHLHRPHPDRLADLVLRGRIA